MNRSIHLLSALAIGAACFAVPTLAHADEKFSLHVDLGAVQPLTAPQDIIYQTGVGMNARGLFNIKPWFSLGPVVQSTYLPKAIDDGSNAGVMWQMGGAFRLQRSHDLLGNDDANSLLRNGVWSPYINMDVTAAHTGNLWRPALGFQVGMDVTTDSDHSFWFGPYLGYTHVFQTDTHQDNLTLDSRDPNLFTAGLSFTWDYPRRVHRVTQVVRDREVVLRAVPVRTVVVVHDAPVAVAEKPLTLTQHVYFDFDKSVLRWESVDKLDEIVAALKNRQGVSIHVQGHASPDGQKAHNEALAAARANAVRDYLVAHGIDASRLTVDSFGVDRPVGDQKKLEGRERSRRVEFEITVTAQ